MFKQQLPHSLEGLQPADVPKLIVAYEPVWAIGTGHCATCDEAQKAQHYCREVLAEAWGEKTADSVEILYGGSVKPDNAAELWEQEDVDGLLVGGCSLDAEQLIQIVNWH